MSAYSLRQEDKTDERIRGLLGEAFLGNPHAMAFIFDLFEAVHTWDDLIDGDVVLEKPSINRAFEAVMVGFNLNPFFRQHAHILTPVLLSGVLNWHAANELEATKERDCLQVAHVIRCAIGDVAMLCAYVIGGMEHARKYAARLRMLMQQDSLHDYLEDFQ